MQCPLQWALRCKTQWHCRDPVWPQRNEFAGRSSVTAETLKLPLQCTEHLSVSVTAKIITPGLQCAGQPLMQNAMRLRLLISSVTAKSKKTWKVHCSAQKYSYGENTMRLLGSSVRQKPWLLRRATVKMENAMRLRRSSVQQKPWNVQFSAPGNKRKTQRDLRRPSVAPLPRKVTSQVHQILSVYSFSCTLFAVRLLFLYCCSFPVPFFTEYLITVLNYSFAGSFFSGLFLYCSFPCFRVPFQLLSLLDCFSTVPFFAWLCPFGCSFTVPCFTCLFFYSSFLYLTHPLLSFLTSCVTLPLLRFKTLGSLLN